MQPHAARENRHSVLDGARRGGGRFRKMPEAKVYLDTPHNEVPGYAPLDRSGGITGMTRLGARAPEAAQELPDRRD